jgi:hypothetical protein
LCAQVVRDNDSAVVVHLIKGSIPKPVRALIASLPHTRLISVHPKGFGVIAWLALFWMQLLGRLRWIVVDNPKRARWVKRSCPRVPVLLVQGDAESPRWTFEGHPQEDLQRLLEQWSANGRDESASQAICAHL